MATLQIGERIELTVTMRGIYQYTAPSFSGWKTETRYIYTMVTDDGTVYVWKSTAFMTFKVRDDERGWETDTKGRKWRHDKINQNDVIRIKASVKGFSEYKDEHQIELTRVTVLDRTYEAPTWEELTEQRKAERERRKKEQLASLAPGDFLWVMPYRQYKEHYSDCETVIDSYDKRDYTPAEITVIIREGRLKPSGVRGQHFHGYEFHVVEDGKKYRACYRAVSEDNALRRLNKDYPNATEIIPGKIYDYGT